jgi:predicted nucleotidyltransferase component of viral defense system
MINIDEVRSVASRVSLTNIVVEKDYALGWLLWGIHRHPIAGNDWVFKGGTCLKKCYFETYRFSEDLDFSYRGESQLTVESLTQIMNEISDLIFEEAGIEFPKASIQFEIFNNPRGTVSIQGGIKYRGPVRPQVGLAQMQRIKIDITLDEPLVLPPVEKLVEHRYSDCPPNGIAILAYDYEEIFAEKTRALAQRLRPRDLYDVVHLFRRMDLNINREKIYTTLEKKCMLRGIPIPTTHSIENHPNRQLLESDWDNQLRQQIPILPDFQSFLSEIPSVFSWLTGNINKVFDTIPTNEFSDEELEVHHEEVNSIVLPGNETSFMDKIRFAASNRLIIRLGYNGEMRDIEPYALARSSEGKLLLRSIKLQNNESRSYRIDKIESLEILHNTFTPKHTIEISSSGYLPIHQMTKKQNSNNFPTGRNHSKNSTTKTQGPVFIYRCGYCQKEFRRSKMDSNLNSHKNKTGQKCAGNYGIFVRTIY